MGDPVARVYGVGEFVRIRYGRGERVARVVRVLAPQSEVLYVVLVFRRTPRKWNRWAVRVHGSVILGAAADPELVATGGRELDG